MTASADAFSLEAYLRRERPRVDAALRRCLEEASPGLTGPLRAVIQDGVLAGGKRLRPLLCVTAFRAAGGRTDGGDGIYDLAASLELIHAYSLMHDDLPCMDDASLRRGRPTPHTIHGERATVLAAAALIPGAGLQVWRAAGALGLSEDGRREALRILARAAGGSGMVGGQVLDLLAEGRSLSDEALNDLHGRKTGALLGASLRLGALAAGAPEGIRTGLAGYGREIGLAFQIADDVLDATAGAEALGKHPSDQALEKSTYVAFLGIDGARAAASGRVEAALAALRRAGIRSPELEALARYVVDRER